MSAGGFGRAYNALLLTLGLSVASSAFALDLTEHEQAGKRLYREGLSASLVAASRALQAHLALARDDIDEADRLGRMAARVDPYSAELGAIEGMVAASTANVARDAGSLR